MKASKLQKRRKQATQSSADEGSRDESEDRQVRWEWRHQWPKTRDHYNRQCTAISPLIPVTTLGILITHHFEYTEMRDLKVMLKLYAGVLLAAILCSYSVW